MQVEDDVVHGDRSGATALMGEAVNSQRERAVDSTEAWLEAL